MRSPQPSDYEHIADYYDALETFPCPTCGAVGLDFDGPSRMTNGETHDAAYHCPNGHWVGWREKPRSGTEAKTRRPRRGKHRLAAPLKTDKCFLCQRTRPELAALGLQLEEAHSTARADLIDAGIPDDPTGHVLLCTPHHRFQELLIAEAERYRRLQADTG